MIVLAHLPPVRLDRLRHALADGDRLLVALDWEHAESLVRREAVDALVVDPAFGAAAVIALRTRFRSVPIVAYTDLGAAALPALLAIGRAGIEQLVLFDVDDEAWQLRAVLAAQPGVALSIRLLEHLRPALQHVPAPIAEALARVIRTPAAFRGVPDLALAAGVSRRTIYRECERARLASPREIIAAARVLRAYAFLRESDHAIEDVAAALRFSSAHHLTRTMRWACGMTTARARDRVGPDEMLAQLVERLLPVRTSTSAASTARR